MQRRDAWFDEDEIVEDEPSWRPSQPLSSQPSLAPADRVVARPTEASQAHNSRLVAENADNSVNWRQSMLGPKALLSARPQRDHALLKANDAASTPKPAASTSRRSANAPPSKDRRAESPKKSSSQSSLRLEAPPPAAAPRPVIVAKRHTWTTPPVGTSTKALPPTDFPALGQKPSTSNETIASAVSTAPALSFVPSANNREATPAPPQKALKASPPPPPAPVAKSWNVTAPVTPASFGPALGSSTIPAAPASISGPNTNPTAGARATASGGPVDYSKVSGGKSNSTNGGQVQMLKRGGTASASSGASDAYKTEPTITFGSFEPQSRSDLPEKAWPGLPGGSQIKTAAAVAGSNGGPPSLVRKATTSVAKSIPADKGALAAATAAAAPAATPAAAVSKKPKPTKGMTVADVLFAKASGGKNANKKAAIAAEKSSNSGGSKSSKGMSELPIVGKKGKSGSFPALPEMPTRGAISLPPKQDNGKNSEDARGGALPSVKETEEDKAFKPVEKTKKKKLSSLKKRILLERVSRWEATNPQIAKGNSSVEGSAKNATDTEGSVGLGVGNNADKDGNDVPLCSPGFEALVKLRGVVCVADVLDEDEYEELLDNLAQLIVPLRFQPHLVDVHVPRQSEDQVLKTDTNDAAKATGTSNTVHSGAVAEVSPDAMVVVTLRFGRSVSAAKGCAEALAGTLVGGRTAQAEWAVVATSEEHVGPGDSSNPDISSCSSGNGASSTAAEENQASISASGVELGEGRAALVVRQFAEEEAVTDPDEREELLENLENLARRLPGFLIASLPTHSSRSSSHNVVGQEGSGSRNDGDDNGEASLARATSAEPGDAALGFSSGAAAEAAAATLRLLVVGGAPLQTEVLLWRQALDQSKIRDESNKSDIGRGQNDSSSTSSSGSSNSTTTTRSATIVATTDPIDRSSGSSSKDEAESGDGPGVVWLLELVQSLDEVSGEGGVSFIEQREE